MNDDLRAWVDGPSHLLDRVDEVVRDDPAGRVGWQWIMDPNATLVAWLPWLAQFGGSRVREGDSEQSQRTRVRDAPSARRGSIAGISAEVAATLEGTRTVEVIERDGGEPYHYRVRTFIGETPDEAATAAAVQASKPAGLIAIHETTAASSWGEVDADYADWQAVFGSYDSWGDVHARPGS